MLGQATSTPTSGADPIIDLSGGAAVWFIVGIAAGLVLLWAIPLYLDARRAYKAYKYLQVPLIREMLGLAGEDKLQLTDEQKNDLLTAATQRFEATTGLARALMAFAVISILGVALVAVLLSSAADATDLRKTIITSLVSILGTIVGFYFGARTAEMGRSRGREREHGGERETEPGREERARQEEREKAPGPNPQEPEGVQEPEKPEHQRAQREKREHAHEEEKPEA